MTPAEEEGFFIKLWQQGASYQAIARALQLKLGTMASRASTLVRQGKIQLRPRGGAYARQQALARQNQAPVQSSADPPPEVMHPPVHTVHRVQAQLYALHGAVQQEVASLVNLQLLLSEVLAPLLSQLAALEGEVKALREQGAAPAQSRVYALHGAEHKDLSPEDRKSERWNIYMPRWLRHLVEQEAAAARLSPSQVLQDVVRQWVERRQQEG